MRDPEALGVPFADTCCQKLDLRTYVTLIHCSIFTLIQPGFYTMCGWPNDFVMTRQADLCFLCTWVRLGLKKNMLCVEIRLKVDILDLGMFV